MTRRHSHHQSTADPRPRLPYLLLDVLEGGGRHDGEADEEDVRLRVGERPQPVVVLLAGRVEQAERVRLAADHHRHGVVVKHLPAAREGRGFESQRWQDSFFTNTYNAKWIDSNINVIGVAFVKE